MVRSLVRDYVLRSERRRLRVTLRWIKRAERYYIRHRSDKSNLGMCGSFVLTCPWWVRSVYPYSDVFSLLFTLCPEFNEDNLTSRFPAGVDTYSASNGFWWVSHMTAPRLASFAYLKDVYEKMSVEIPRL